MDKKEKLEKINSLLKVNGLFIGLSMDNINHKPHNYTIGSEHVKYAAEKHGGMLGEETCRKVRCARPNCNVPYDDHTSDEICFLKLTRSITNEEAKTELKNLVDTLGEKFLDGFSFIETPEKFRMGD